MTFNQSSTLTITLTGGTAAHDSNSEAPAPTYLYIGGITVTRTASNVSDAAATSTNRTYNGSAQTGVTKVTLGGQTLTLNTDYTVTYKNNTNAGTASYTIKGTGSYAGTLTGTFTINPKSIKASDVTLGSVAAQTYSGSAKTPTLTIKDGTRNVNLTKDTDYTLAYTNNTNAGTATITIAGKGNYNNSRTTTFTINAKSLTAAMLTVDSKVYNGSKQTATTSVKDGTTAIATSNYTLTNAGGTNVGGYEVKLVGKGNYTGTITKTFNITAKTLTDAMVTLSASSFTYNGSSQKPTATISDKVNNKEILATTDYTLTNNGGTNAGTYNVTVVGKSNYTGTVTKSFTIGAKSLTAAMLTVDSKVYNGSKQTATTSVKDGTTAIATSNYTLTNAGGTNVGGYEVKLVGKGNYTGTITKTFKITAKSINAQDITVSNVAATQFTGAAITPNVTIKDGTRNVNLTVGSGNDYTVSYENNVEAGTGTITITGVKNYADSRTVDFVITPVTQDANSPMSGWGTFSCAHSNVIVPDGVSVYYCTQLEADENGNNSLIKTIKMEGNVIKKNTGVLFSTTPSQTVSFTYTTKEAEDEYYGNMLLPTGDGIHVDKYETIGGREYLNFTLQGGKFWPVVQESADVKMPANKAYLHLLRADVEGTAHAKEGCLDMSVCDENDLQYSTHNPNDVPRDLLFDEDSETQEQQETVVLSVSELEAKNENGQWYTLHGQQLKEKPQKRGVYIVNGKKVIVR